MRRLSPKSRRILLIVSLAVLALAAGWSAWTYLLRPWLFPPSPLAHTPQVGLEQLQAKSLYYNDSDGARGWLQQFRPDLLPTDHRDTLRPEISGFAQATQEPRNFPILDRHYHFDTILLLGDPSNFARLLEHLLTPEPAKRTFRLVYLDHWMYVFKRGAPREWEPSDAAPLRERMASLRSEDRAYFLAKSAERMIAVSHLDAAKKWLDEALAADGSSADVLAAFSSYYAALSRWPESESYADKALERDPNSVPALQRKVTALMGTKHLPDAFKYSDRLVKLVTKRSGENPGLLRQHATIAHRARRFDVEIATLTRLIVLAQAANWRTGEYEFALAEAHASAAQEDSVHAPRAVEHYKRALMDRELLPEMRKWAADRLQSIAEKTGIR